MMRMKVVGLLGIWITLSSAAWARVPQGKLIETGWDSPAIPFLRDHLAEMEKIPFDGLVLDVGNHGEANSEDRHMTLIYHGWANYPMPAKARAKIEEDIKTLASLKFKRFTDNFIHFLAYPGCADWFDDADFKHVLDNWRVAARAVKQTRFRGIFFDGEPYMPEYQIFYYDKQKYKAKYNFQQYRDKVYQRAREIMKIINEECPTITIMFTIGNEYPLGHLKDLPKNTYGMVPDFIDGFLDEAGPTVTIVDGDEMAYGLRLEADFKGHAQMVTEKCAILSRNPSTYPKRIKPGAPVWLDYAHPVFPWYNQPLDYNKNYYNPDEFAYAVHSALKHFKYVWIYSEIVGWWSDKMFPHKTNQKFSQDYVNALAGARQENVPVPPLRKMGTCRWDAEQNDYVALTPFWEKNRPVTALPGIWKFHLDAADEGEKGRWFREDFSDTAWDLIVVPEFWEYVKNEWAGYDGLAWYRVKFKLPLWAKGKKLTLLFAGVDEEAKVWLNGSLLGEHAKGSSGWIEPFSFDVTDKLRLDGKDNQVTVQVHDTTSYGGIWRAVYVITPVK